MIALSPKLMKLRNVPVNVTISLELVPVFGEFREIYLAKQGGSILNANPGSDLSAIQQVSR